MKYFGIALILFSVTQMYLWVFGIINLNGDGAVMSLLIIIIVEFVSGLLATGIVKPI